MPIYWRYFSRAYLKVFILSLFGFIFVLLITRLKDIAKFSALSSSFKQMFLYVFYQIPHILPIAVSISCLISSFILFNSFSKSSELTALRSNGFSIKKIIFPVILLSIFISFFNFFISSIITPQCRINSKKISRLEISKNPLVLLEKHKLLKIENAYVDVKISNDKTSAKNLIFIIPNKANKRLNFISADNMRMKNENLTGENLSIISFFDSEKENGFDSLMIENQKQMTTQALNLSKYMKTEKFSLKPCHLSTKMLIIKTKLNISAKNLKDFSSKDLSSKDLLFKKLIPIIEIIKRFSLSFSAFTFTFIGICFGININRENNKKKLFEACFCALFILLSFIVGKSLKYNFLLANICFLLPQLLILFISLKSLKKISRGIG